MTAAEAGRHAAAIEAEQAQQHGYAVFNVALSLEVHPRTGKPTKIAQFPPSWQAASTTDPGVLRWIDRQQGYGIDCGASGIVAVDLDVSGTTNGLALWEERGYPESPLTVDTQAGGQHLFFRADPAAPIPIASFGELGIDVRGIGGLVYGPGTSVAGGGVYERDGDWLRPDELPPVPAALLLELKAENDRLKRDRAASRVPDAFGEVTGTAVEQIQARVDQHLAILEESMGGGFNDALNRYCFQVGRLFATWDAVGEPVDCSLEAAVQYVVDALTDSPVTDPPDGNDMKTIRSSTGLRGGLKHPYTEMADTGALADSWGSVPGKADEGAAAAAAAEWGSSGSSDPHGPSIDQELRERIKNSPPLVRDAYLRAKAAHAAQQLLEEERFPYAAKVASRGFSTAAELYKIAREKPREFLINRVLHKGSYAALGAEYKAGKTWLVADLTVSLLTGTPWLGAVDTTRGRVAVMHSEGDMREYFTRLEAVARHKDVELTDSVLDGLMVQDGSSMLSDPAAVNRLYSDLEAFGPDLIVIDPWYLSAGEEADGKTLSRTGAVLRNLQGVAAELDSAILITTHWNKAGEGSGFGRWSGAGLQEWGRVLINVGVGDHKDAQAYNVDPTGRTTAELTVDVKGQTSGSYALTRAVWSDDVAKADTRMHYEAVVRAPEARSSSPATDRLQELRNRVLRALADAEADRQTPIIQAALFENMGLAKGRATTDARAALDQAVHRGLVLSTDSGLKSGGRVMYQFQLTEDGATENQRLLGAGKELPWETV